MGLVQDGTIEIACNEKKITRPGLDVKAEDLLFTLKINGAWKDMPPHVFTYSIQNGTGYSGECAVKNDGEGIWSFIHKTLVFDDEVSREILFIVSHPSMSRAHVFTIRATKENTGYYFPPAYLVARGFLHSKHWSLATVFEFDKKLKHTPLRQGGDVPIRTRCRRLRYENTTDTEFSEAPDNPFLSVSRTDAEKLKLNIPVIHYGSDIFFPLSYEGDGYYEARGVIKHLPAGNYMLGVRLPKDPYMNYGRTDISILSERDYKGMMSEIKKFGNEILKRNKESAL